MSAESTPYGLIPINKIGGQNNAGAFREFPMAANNSNAIFNGDLVVLADGQPAAVGSTPTAIDIPASAGNAENATPGIVGVCVGCRYIDTDGQLQFRNFVPANLVTGGATQVFVRVVDDPDQLFRIKGTAALGTFNSGTDGSGYASAIGKNAALDFNTSGSTSTGKAGVALLVGTNGGSIATTNTLAMRIIDVWNETQADDYPEFVVKYNVGVHAYQNSLGV